MIIGTELESFEMADAYVGARDVVNKVSDLLLLRLDRELCACACAGDFGRGVGAGKEEGTGLRAMHLTRELKTEFSRYRYDHQCCYQCC